MALINDRDVKLVMKKKMRVDLKKNEKEKKNVMKVEIQSNYGEYGKV